MRLDVLVTQRGLAESRERAQALIMSGSVTVAGRRVDKAGAAVPEDAVVEVSGPALPYVSRGGLKLAHALEAFRIDVAGVIAVDVGASTGGFTDCLLQRGASRVYAIDVGRGQLHARLRSDPRVVTMEGVNARYLTALPEAPALATFDLSFISLLKVVPALAPLLTRPGTIIALIKPQFEAGPKLVGKGGVVRRPEVRRDVVREVLDGLALYDVAARGLATSPVRGAAGNVEYLAYATLGATTDPPDVEALIASVDWT